MRSLEQALYDHELLVLRVIGEWWELELTGADKNTCVSALVETLSQLDMVQMINYLPPEDAAALSDLVKQSGRIPVPTFSRDHGEVRLMGPGRLEREEPWLDPISAAEGLWYRGFLYRGFDELPEGVIEFYFLPQELLAQFQQNSEVKMIKEREAFLINPVPAPEKINQAVTDAVDDLTTMLAQAQRVSLPNDRLNWDLYLLNPELNRRSLLMTLATETGMLRMTDKGLRPTRTAVDWLNQSRESQLRTLADAWSSTTWNELCHTPGLSCEGEGWENDPLLARTALLDALPRSLDWYAQQDLVGQIKQTDPDFQRPDGNYDVWYIRDLANDTYIKGFANWDMVEGRLIRFLLDGPCYWLGLVEMAGGRKSPLYRLTPRALDWLANSPTVPDAVEVPLVVQADGSLLVPYNAGRYQRFQAARISEPEPVQPGQPFHYRLTPGSLALAREQGITPDRIIQFLADSSSRPVPTSVQHAITRWVEKGVEGRVEPVVVLRVREADVLETLRKNTKTRDYIGESLGDLAAVVRQKDWQRLVSASVQLGLFLEVIDD